MAADPILIIATRQELEPARGQAGAIRSVVADYWALTKPEVNLLIAVATFSGFYLAYPGPVHDFPWLRLVHTLLGTLLVAGGTGALNQYVERRFDAQMRRTARRPLAAGRVKPWAVLWFGIALASVGSIYLATTVNLLASLLAIATLLSYLFLYTPLKRETPLCTLIGAFPGAVPPLIGWAAASGTLTVEAWIIYAMLFLWQFPHFMAIACMYREDYDRAGYLVLPSGKARISFVTRQTILPLLALLPISLLVASGGQLGIPSRIGTLLLSLGFVYYGAQFVLRRSNAAARRLLLASIIYLPSLLILIVLLRGWRTL
jgi:protoheme IX farnesyltransferase